MHIRTDRPFLLVTLVCLLCATGTLAATGQREKALTRKQALLCEEQLKAAWLDSVRTATGDAYNRKMVQADSLTMRLDWKIFGSPGPHGYALYISLHGGGGTAPENNDQQWRNQMRLYRPKNAVYLCPRAPYNSWDLHFRSGVDEMYRRIILMAQAWLQVDPDHVYIMGYSAGGDGVWRLAPRHADVWAAASMMAGHPGDVSLLNLRNLPFMIWCGEQDAAYDRNRQCRQRIAQMDSLQADDPEGYVHQGHIIEGKGHWMDRIDTAAVDWMGKYSRQPYPKRIVWQQADIVKPHFYWLTAPTDELKRGKQVRAEVQGNTVSIERCDYSRLTLSLSDRLVNLDRRVTVVYKGRTLFHGKVKRRASTLRRTLYGRNDPAYMVPAQIELVLPRS